MALKDLRMLFEKVLRLGIIKKPSGTFWRFWTKILPRDFPPGVVC
jgi:hypothetical protein